MENKKEMTRKEKREFLTKSWKIIAENREIEKEKLENGNIWD